MVVWVSRARNKMFIWERWGDQNICIVTRFPARFKKHAWPRVRTNGHVESRSSGDTFLPALWVSGTKSEREKEEIRRISDFLPLLVHGSASFSGWMSVVVHVTWISHRLPEALPSWCIVYVLEKREDFNSVLFFSFFEDEARFDRVYRRFFRA